MEEVEDASPLSMGSLIDTRGHDGHLSTVEGKNSKVFVSCPRKEKSVGHDTRRTEQGYVRAATERDNSYGDAAIAIVADEGGVKSDELNLGLLTRCSRIKEL